METEGGSQLFETQKREGHKKWAVKRARVVQIYARDHAEVQKKKGVLYSVKKKKNLGEVGESSDQLSALQRTD